MVNNNSKKFGSEKITKENKSNKKFLNYILGFVFGVFRKFIARANMKLYSAVLCWVPTNNE